jgi:hypothetical protein
MGTPTLVAAPSESDTDAEKQEEQAIYEARIWAIHYIVSVLNGSAKADPAITEVARLALIANGYGAC